MNTKLRLTLIALACPLLALAQDDSIKPVTAAQALKLGAEKLATEHMKDESEAGQDEAAQLYATALRLKTENALAKKDLRDVDTLAHMRETLSNCRESSIDLAGFINGGGSMFGHASARDCAAVEIFLSEIVELGFPPAAGEGSSKARKAVDQHIAFLKKLKPGEAANDKEMLAEFNKYRQEGMQAWENLGYLLDGLSQETADAFVEFALDTTEWLKEEN
jgi:hypothetical protein